VMATSPARYRPTRALRTAGDERWVSMAARPLLVAGAMHHATGDLNLG
jgi:hypothetical protein